MIKKPIRHDYTISDSGWAVVSFACLGPGTVTLNAFGLKPQKPHQETKELYLLVGEEIVIRMPDGDVLFGITKITYWSDPCDMYSAELRYIQHLTGWRCISQYEPEQRARQREWAQKVRGESSPQ